MNRRDFLKLSIVALATRAISKRPVNADISYGADLTIQINEVTWEWTGNLETLTIKRIGDGIDCDCFNSMQCLNSSAFEVGGIQVKPGQAKVERYTCERRDDGKFDEKIEILVRREGWDVLAIEEDGQVHRLPIYNRTSNVPGITC